MAGPAYLSVGTVVDPYAGAQKALSQVGDIYNSFYDNQKKAEEARNHRLQREELQKQSDLQQQRRDTLSTYDPNLGVDGRGIETELYNRSIEEENEIRARNAAALEAGHSDAIPSSELEKKLAEARKTLVTRKAAERTIAGDLLRTGTYSPDEIASLTPLYSMNARDLTAELTAHQQAIKNQQEIDKAKRDAALEIQKLYGTDDATKAKVYAAQQSGYNSLNRSDGSSNPSGTRTGKRPPNLDAKGYNEFQSWAEKQLGSKVWNLDGREAEILVSNTAANINKELDDAGWGRNTFVTTGETAEFVINNVHAGWWDRSLRSDVDSQPKFEAAFSAMAGLPPRNADGGFLTPKQVEEQGGNPNAIRNDSRGYGRDILPAPNLTGVRPELVDTVRTIPDYKTKTREDLYTEMLDNAYKNLRLPPVSPVDEFSDEQKAAAVAAVAAKNANTGGGTPPNTPIQKAINQATGKGNTDDPKNSANPEVKGNGQPTPEVITNNTSSQQEETLAALQARRDELMSSFGLQPGLEQLEELGSIQSEIAATKQILRDSLPPPKPLSPKEQALKTFIVDTEAEIERLKVRGRSPEVRRIVFELQNQLRAAKMRGVLPSKSAEQPPTENGNTEERDSLLWDILNQNRRR